MITRRKLLAFLGLGGAAAAVASKVEALGETNGAIEHVEYAGPMLEDMPLIDLNDHRTPADFDHVALFARDEGDHKPPSLALSSTKPVGEGWARLTSAERERSLELQRGMVEADRYAFDALCEFDLRGRKP